MFPLYPVFFGSGIFGTTGWGIGRGSRRRGGSLWPCDGGWAGFVPRPPLRLKVTEARSRSQLHRALRHFLLVQSAVKDFLADGALLGGDTLAACWTCARAGIIDEDRRGTSDHRSRRGDVAGGGRLIRADERSDCKCHGDKELREAHTGTPFAVEIIQWCIGAEEPAEAGASPPTAEFPIPAMAHREQPVQSVCYLLSKTGAGSGETCERFSPELSCAGPVQPGRRRAIHNPNFERGCDRM